MNGIYGYPIIKEYYSPLNKQVFIIIAMLEKIPYNIILACR